MSLIEKNSKALKKLGINMQISEEADTITIQLLPLNSRSSTNIGKARKLFPAEFNGKKVVIKAEGSVQTTVPSVPQRLN